MLRDAFARRPTGLALGLLFLAAAVAYSTSLVTPFVFDDQFAIVENPSIRHWEKIGAVLSPPPSAAGAAGRPLVNLTLAVNHALGGLNPWGYHAFNLVIHLLATLTLFGIVRRTLAFRKSPTVSAPGAERAPFAAWAKEGAGVSSGSSTLFAFSVALLWSVHPLLTESVTGVIQRDELLGSLFYLLTLYGFIRFAGSGAKRWAALCLLACLVGTAAKEIIVSAPVVVLLYDRTFIAGNFRAAWRRHRGLYLGLASTWLPLGWLMLTSRQRGGTVGFGLGVSSGDYLLTQGRALALYLKLSVWPHPLVLDYGTDVIRRAADVAPQGIALLLLAAGTVAGVVRRSAAGFLGACFFAILAPSSSIVPLVSQPIAEHRMYLPLAAVVALAVGGLSAWAGRRSLAAWPFLAVALGALTLQRNADYRSEAVLTRQALAANSHNDRAWLNLGTFAARQGKTTEAIDDYQMALGINPAAADTQFYLAGVLEQAGRAAAALAHYREAVRLRPAYPVAQYRLGLALVQAGREEEALVPLERARQLQPDSPAVRTSLARVHADLGNALAQAGRMPEAIAHYEAALGFDPDLAPVHNNLANVLSQLGRPAEAIAHYEAAVRARPDYEEAQYNLAIALLEGGRIEEAKAHLRAALRLRPDDDQARRDLARAESLGGK